MAQERRTRTSLAALPDSAAATLVKHLEEQGSLQAARLVSSCWRSVIDGHASRIQLKLSPEDWGFGQQADATQPVNAAAFPHAPTEVQAAGDGGLPALLDNLPASLQHLHYSWSQPRDARRRNLQLSLQQQAGSDGHRINTVRIAAGTALCSAYVCVARPLLACRAMGPRLRGVVLQGSLFVPEEALERSDCAPLWDLLRRAAHASISSVSAEALAHVAPVLDLLHRLRQLMLLRGCAAQALRLSPPATAAPVPGCRAVKEAAGAGGGALDSSGVTANAGTGVADGGGGGIDGSGHGAPPALPSPTELADAVVRRMVMPAPAATPSGADASGSGAVACRAVGTDLPNAALDDAATGNPLAPGACFLLRGPLIAGLIRTPELLKRWTSWLGSATATAEVAAAGANGGGNGAGGAAAAAAAQCFVSYQVLPAAGAVVVQARKGAAEAALQAAVAAVNGRQGAANVVTLSRVTLAGDTPGLLGQGQQEARLAQRAYLGAMIQELQALWDRRVGACGGSWEAERALLRRLLGLWERLDELPPETRL